MRCFLEGRSDNGRQLSHESLSSVSGSNHDHVLSFKQASFDGALLHSCQCPVTELAKPVDQGLADSEL